MAERGRPRELVDRVSVRVVLEQRHVDLLDAIHEREGLRSRSEALRWVLDRITRLERLGDL